REPAGGTDGLARAAARKLSPGMARHQPRRGEIAAYRPRPLAWALLSRPFGASTPPRQEIAQKKSGTRFTTEPLPGTISPGRMELYISFFFSHSCLPRTRQAFFLGGRE